VTQRALDSDRLKTSAGLEEACQSNDCVQSKERKSSGRIVEIDLPSSQGVNQIPGQLPHRPEPHRERRFRAYAVDLEIRRRDAPERGSLDGVVQTEQVAPERLIAESIKAESPAALPDHLPRVACDRTVEAGEERSVFRLAG
jgi:hypothetical protein